MSDDPPSFKPDAAFDAIPQGAQGDFLLPICLPVPGLLVGEDLAVLVLTTVEGQRVGVPMGVEALSDLQKVALEALRMLQVGEGDAVQ